MREALISIPDAELSDQGIGRLLRYCRAAGLESLTELACQSDGCLLVFTVSEPLPEAELDDCPDLAWWEHRGNGSTPLRYSPSVNRAYRGFTGANSKC